MKYFTFFFAVTLCMSCSKKDHLEVDLAVANAPMEMRMPSTNEQPLQEKQKTTQIRADSIAKKIIKNGSMKIQVGDLNKSRSKIEEQLQKLGAYVQDEEFNNSDDSDNLYLTIRVPHRNFDLLVHSFTDGIGSVLSKSIKSDDVTEEYTDVSIKLANKKLYLEKYRELLRRAASTKDMLEIQEKIRGLEEEIDVSEGRLRYIDDNVNYSTLELYLVREKARDTITSRIGFGNRFADSIAQGWNTFVGFMLGLVALWPFFLLIPVIIFIFRKWKSRKKFKKD